VSIRVIIFSGGMMKAYSSREIIRILETDGWYLYEIEGSHHQYEHPSKKGKVTVKHTDYHTQEY